MRILKQFFVVPVFGVLFLSMGSLAGSFAWNGQSGTTSFINAHEVDFQSNTSVNFVKNISSENFVMFTQTGSMNNNEFNNGFNSPSISFISDNKQSSNEAFNFERDVAFQNKSLIASTSTF